MGKKKNIFLIGFMGAGKSSVGRLLSEKLQMEFVDMDEEIVKLDGRDIPAIFRESGEEYFREVEGRVLEELCYSDGKVISCGGGIIVKKRNIELMRENGIVIWLWVSVDEVLRRLSMDESRPLLCVDNPEDVARRLLEVRIPLYETACDVKIDTDGRSVSDVVDEIVGYLKRMEWI